MQFTVLELTLLGAFITMLSAVSTRLFFSNRYMPRTECTSERKKLCDERELFRELARSLKEGQQIQFRMLRAIVSHMELPADVRAEILNEK